MDDQYGQGVRHPTKLGGKMRLFFVGSAEIRRSGRRIFLAGASVLVVIGCRSTSVGDTLSTRCEFTDQTTHVVRVDGMRAFMDVTSAAVAGYHVALVGPATVLHGERQPLAFPERPLLGMVLSLEGGPATPIPAPETAQPASQTVTVRVLRGNDSWLLLWSERARDAHGRWVTTALWEGEFDGAQWRYARRIDVSAEVIAYAEALRSVAFRHDDATVYWIFPANREESFAWDRLVALERRGHGWNVHEYDTSGPISALAPVQGSTEPAVLIARLTTQRELAVVYPGAEREAVSAVAEIQDPDSPQELWAVADGKVLYSAWHSGVSEFSQLRTMRGGVRLAPVEHVHQSRGTDVSAVTHDGAGPLLIAVLDAPSRSMTLLASSVSEFPLEQVATVTTPFAPGYLYALSGPNSSLVLVGLEELPTGPATIVLQARVICR